MHGKVLSMMYSLVPKAELLWVISWHKAVICFLMAWLDQFSQTQETAWSIVKAKKEKHNILGGTKNRKTKQSLNSKLFHYDLNNRGRSSNNNNNGGCRSCSVPIWRRCCGLQNYLETRAATRRRSKKKPCCRYICAALENALITATWSIRHRTVTDMKFHKSRYETFMWCFSTQNGWFPSLFLV